jgi:4-amino-4-deoxy-L-arabinose transferase-like glycosyltransferase
MGAVFNAAAGGIESSGPDWWTLGAGLLGVLAGVIANHFFTRSRERGAELREAQIAANTEFRAKFVALRSHVITGPVEEAIQRPNFVGLAEAIRGHPDLGE